ncbi:MAG TPA: hypothetical protein VHO84_01530 [Syntrophorhabdaceae bacterium]|nr:hypothetical protein [Syntrophorhabdaceae bacterium]
MKKLQITSIALFLSALLLTGCSSSLKTFDEKQRLSVGIPINTPVLVKVTERTIYAVDPRNREFEEFCVPSISTTFQYHTLGERSYVAFDPAFFGKGEFKIEFHENGGLKSIVLNSDASTGVDKMNDLLKTVAPYIAAPLGLTKEMKTVQEGTAQSMKEKYCIKTQTEIISIERIKQYPE